MSLFVSFFIDDVDRRCVLIYVGDTVEQKDPYGSSLVTVYLTQWDFDKLT